MRDPYKNPNFIVRETDNEIIMFEPPKMPFGKKLTIYFAVLAAIVIILLAVTWSAVEQFDVSRPIYAMEKYMSTSKQDMFFSAVSNTELDKKNQYEPLYEIAGTVAKYYQDKFTFSQSEEFTTDEPVYIIRHGDTDIFKVTLEYHAKTGFLGYVDYVVKSIELLDKSLFTFNTYKFVFPSNSYVFINGHRVEPTITVEHEKFEIFETGRATTLGDNYYKDRYNSFYGVILENFMFEPTVSAQQYVNYGYTSSLECHKEDNYFIIDFEEPKLRTITVSAPEEASVYVNNYLVSDCFLTDTSVYSDEMKSEIAMKEYTIPTAYQGSTVSAYIGDSLLEIEADGSSYTVLPQTAELTDPIEE